ncbi:hypothetical protein BHE74_00021199 [Ensete ventricosum]|nr:hypothetical protein BHE74_00021199 [Ensete ventricosum]RZS01156.1 hypothetical protein BHM03_00030974 [Ensete ventricosum]
MSIALRFVLLEAGHRRPLPPACSTFEPEAVSCLADLRRRSPGSQGHLRPSCTPTATSSDGSISSAAPIAATTLFPPCKDGMPRSKAAAFQWHERRSRAVEGWRLRLPDGGRARCFYLPQDEAEESRQQWLLNILNKHLWLSVHIKQAEGFILLRPQNNVQSCKHEEYSC